MKSEARKRANRRHEKKNLRQISLKLNINTDKAILAKLDSLKNKQGYIKELILKDIQKE